MDPGAVVRQGLARCPGCENSASLSRSRTPSLAGEPDALLPSSTSSTAPRCSLRTQNAPTRPRAGSETMPYSSRDPGPLLGPNVGPVRGRAAGELVRRLAVRQRRFPVEQGGGHGLDAAVGDAAGHLRQQTAALVPDALHQLVRPPPRRRGSSSRSQRSTPPKSPPSYSTTLTSATGDRRPTVNGRVRPLDRPHPETATTGPPRRPAAPATTGSAPRCENRTLNSTLAETARRVAP